MTINERPTARRKNAREDFRHLTDAEAVAAELERSIRSLRLIAAQLIPQQEAESTARLDAVPRDDFMAEAFAALAKVKGRMYLERIAMGLSARDIADGTGWSEHTLRQFEGRESDGLVSSLFRVAAGLRRAGIPGRIVIQWVPDYVPKEKARKGEAA